MSTQYRSIFSYIASVKHKFEIDGRKQHGIQNIISLWEFGGVGKVTVLSITTLNRKLLKVYRDKYRFRN